MCHIDLPPNVDFTPLFKGLLTTAAGVTRGSVIEGSIHVR